MPSYQVKQATTAYPLVFLLVSSTDHIAGLTGLTPTVTLSKAGAAFAAPAGTVAEIGNGWYRVAGNATDSGTLGPLLLHATATGADPTDALYEVVAYDPQDAVRLGLTNLDATVSSRSTYAGGAVASVTGAVGSVTADVGITQAAADKAWTSTTRTLTAFTFPVTASSVTDKTGYSLATAPPTLTQIVAGVWDESQAGHGTTGTFGARIDAAISSRSSHTAADVWAVATRTITGGTITTYTGNTPQTGDAYARLGAAGAGLTALGDTRLANLDALVSSRSVLTAAGVWDLSTTGHTNPGSFGSAMNAAGSAGDPWATSLPGSYGAGTAGALLASRSSHTAADIWAVGTRTLTAFGFTVTVGTNNDKTGYALTQAFPANFAALAITATTGRVDVASIGGVAASLVSTVDANVVTWKGTAPNDLVTGKVDAAATVSLGATAPAGWLNAAAFAANAITAATLAADVAAEIDTQLSTTHGSGLWGGGTGGGGSGITIADVQTALTNQGYTTTRAGKLDFLDVATSTRLAAAGYTAPTNPTDYARNNVAPTWYAAPPTDYQQRTVAVTLPTTPPTGYGGATAAALVSTLTTTAISFRDLTAVASPTVMDAYAAAIVAAAGAEAVVGTAYTRKTPTGGTFRSFTLATAPGDQARS